jgi:hypothetical protein
VKKLLDKRTVFIMISNKNRFSNLRKIQFTGT